MRSISADLKAHLAQQYHTLATCWRVTLHTSEVRCFTNHDQDLIVGGETYRASSGYNANEVQSDDALNVSNMEVAGMLIDDSMTEEELSTGLWDYAKIQVFLVNWADLTQGKVILRSGRLGEVSTGKQTFRAELRGLTQAYTRVIGELTSPSCRASLGDHRCQVDLFGGSPSLAVTGVVTGVDPDNATVFDDGRTEPGPAGGYSITEIDSVGQRVRFSMLGVVALENGMSVSLSGIQGPALLNGIHVIKDVQIDPASALFMLDIDISDTGLYPDYTGGGVATPLENESGYFDYGVLTFTSGANNGRSMEVRQYTEGMITLSLPMPYPIEVGDTYTMTPGCDKFLTTCRDKFSNVVNFRGEPYLPGRDKVVQVGRRG